MHVAIDAGPGPEPRIPLSRQRVLRAAVRVADEGGIGSLTMRRLAQELEAEAMSLYHHVANKEDVLTGVVDVIAQEINEAVDPIDLPSRGSAWKKAARHRILTAREVLLRHPWSPALFQERADMSPAVMRYFDALVGLMRDGGFSNDLAHHALHALGSRALGFSQEIFAPNDASGGEQGAQALEGMADELPHLVGLMAEIAHDDPDSTLGWCDDQAEFEFGLDLVLDGLDRMRASA